MPSAALAPAIGPTPMPVAVRGPTAPATLGLPPVPVMGAIATTAVLSGGISGTAPSPAEPALGPNERNKRGADTMDGDSDDVGRRKSLRKA